MPRHANLSGHSGVVSYETTPASITLTFVGGERSVHDHARPGREAVNRMKALAEAGRGLGAFVARHVRESYARRL